MKKIVSLAVLAALTTTVANAAPSYIKRDAHGGYGVTYDYTDKAKNGWYVGGHVALNLMSWENEYSTDWAAINAQYNSDKYSEVVFGGDIFFGKTFKYFWRAELEAGLLGQFEDKDNIASFELTIPYLMANGYYDFVNGFYVGAGLGIAVPTTALDGSVYVDGDRKSSIVSPMLGIMVGYSHELDYNLTLDVRYRLAGLMGPDHERIMTDGIDSYTFKNEIGLILDNSLSIGIRYNF